MNNKTFDIAIIGNGITGTTAALLASVKHSDLSIALIGPRERPGSASAAAGAMLNLFAELEVGSLENTFFRRKFELGLEAANIWPKHVELLNELSGGSNSLQIRYGTYVLNTARADQMDDLNFNAIVAAAEKYGEPFELVNPAEIVGYSPRMAFRALRAINLKREGYIPSRTLLSTIDNAVDKGGVITRLNAHVEKVSKPKDFTLSLRSGEQVSAAKVLLANGAAAQELISQFPDLAARIPRIFYGVGCGVVFRPEAVELSSVIRTPNRGMACGVHVVPDADSSTIYVGASNATYATPRFHPRMTSVHNLLSAAMDEIDVRYVDAGVEQYRVGWRPVSSDLLPLIGPTSIDGLTILSGTKRDGLFMSPVYAEAAVNALLTGEECFQGVFRPERRLIKTMTREEGIKKAVSHLWSVAYEHQMQLPRTFWDDRFNNMLHRFVVDQYEKAGDPEYGIPPELIYLYANGEVKETSA